MTFFRKSNMAAIPCARLKCLSQTFKYADWWSDTQNCRSKSAVVFEKKNCEKYFVDIWMLFANGNVAAKRRARFKRLSQTSKYSDCWSYTQNHRSGSTLVVEKKIFEYYFMLFIGFLQMARWPPNYATDWDAFRKLAKTLASDDMAKIWAQMVCWFWRRRFL